MLKDLTKAIIFFVATLISSIAIANPTANITVKVIDEEGHPIGGAIAYAVFEKPKQAGQGWGNIAVTIEETTDSDGIAEFSDATTPRISYGAYKEGYYKTRHEYKFKNISGVIGFRNWLPDSPILTVILKKKIKPIALYARTYRAGIEALYLPKTNIAIGYDLTEGDWVIPYGKGTHKDFIFHLKGKVDNWNRFDVTLELSFANKGDGIQAYDTDSRFGSDLRLPHNAPVGGYLPQLNKRYARLPERFLADDFPENRNYFFRVRTKLNTNGKVESALYGKMHGNIRFAENGLILLNYYLNPNENDTNLEFDVNKNLFKNLNRRLKVDYP